MKEMVVMSSLATGLDVLRALAEPPFNYTLSELATSMNIGRSGLYKILSQLREKNFVHQDRSSKKYHLGPVMLRMGNVYSGIIGIEKIAAPILSYLCKTIGESVYISIWEGDRAYPVFKCCRPDGIYDTKDFIGKNIPINADLGQVVVLGIEVEVLQQGAPGLDVGRLAGANLLRSEERR